MGVPVVSRRGLLRMDSVVSSAQREAAGLAMGNEAERVSFAGMAVGICLALTGPRTPWHVGNDSLVALVDTLMWSCIGIGLMVVSRLVNDFGLLYRQRNAGPVLDGNVAVGVVEAGAFVASGLIVRASTSGEDGSQQDEWANFLSTLIWFAVGQVVLLLATFLVQLLTRYDDQKLIFDGNVAAGVKFSGTLVSMGILASHPITVSDSALTFASFTGIGIVLQTAMRMFLDRIVLPHVLGRRIDIEIEQDGNWGVAAVEASISISLALVGTALMTLPYGGCADIEVPTPAA